MVRVIMGLLRVALVDVLVQRVVRMVVAIGSNRMRFAATRAG